MSDNNSGSPQSGDVIQPERMPGAMLRELREAAGLSQAAVGEALHLTTHYIRALESDEYGKLPALTFVKGYLRSYARLLHTDADVVLAGFEMHISGLVDEGQRTAQVQRLRRRHDQALRWAIATSVILVLGIAGGWWFKGKEQNVASASIRSPQQAAVLAAQPAAAQNPAGANFQAEELAAADGTQDTARTGAQVSLEDDATVSSSTSAAAAPDSGAALQTTEASTQEIVTELPAVAPTNTDAAEPAAPSPAVQSGDELTITPAANGARVVSLISMGDDLLELSFSGNSWVEIDDGEDVRLYNDMLRAGDALTVQGEAPFHVLLGAAANVTVRLNSELVDIAGNIRTDSTARLVLDAAAVAGAER